VADHEDRHAWERSGAFEVADGVHRIPLPLPGDGLKAVNVYAIDQPGGLVLIDSGWAIGQAREQLEAALASLDHDLGSVQRVLVTHVHRDHYELGMHLQRLFGSRLALGIGEQPSLQGLIDEPTPEHAPMTQRLQRAGAAPLIEALGRARERQRERGERPDIDWRLPDEWLHDSQAVQLDGRTLQVVATPGHTQGHVVFVDDQAGVLFSGDHVLPHITPSIGFEQLPVESALADYLASLALVRAMPDHRMLPAHGPVRPTTHDRIDELLAHHEHRLRQSADAVAAGHTTAYEVARALPWTRRERAFDDLDVFNQMLAVNETAAHLDVLVRRGELAATETGDGPGSVTHYG
jgi:glyoxylase-like metal-dependent hydrolase (beta-lactamase superfamily II)